MCNVLSVRTYVNRKVFKYFVFTFQPDFDVCRPVGGINDTRCDINSLPVTGFASKFIVSTPAMGYVMNHVSFDTGLKGFTRVSSHIKTNFITIHISA